MSRRNPWGRTPKAPKPKPINMKLAAEFWNNVLHQTVLDAGHAYVSHANPDLFESAYDLGRFVDTAFGPDEDREFATAAWALHERSHELSTRLGARLIVSPTFETRIFCVPSTTKRKGALIRARLPTFSPLAHDLPASEDPSFNGTWVNPFTGDVERIPHCRIMSDVLVHADSMNRLDALVAFVEDHHARARMRDALSDFLSRVVEYSGSTRSFVNALTGLRDILPTLGISQPNLDEWTSPYRGKDTFDAIGLRLHYPLWISEWQTKYRPALIAMALARKARAVPLLLDLTYTRLA